MKQLITLTLMLTFILTACQSQTVKTVGQPISVEGGTYTNITPEELNAMLANKDFVFVNVHIPFEGQIANTDLFIPYDQITESPNLAQLPQDKNAKIFMYCQSGRMSTIAAQEFVKLGYTNILNLDGGMIAWEEAGFTIESK